MYLMWLPSKAIKSFIGRMLVTDQYCEFENSNKFKFLAL